MLVTKIFFFRVLLSDFRQGSLVSLAGERKKTKQFTESAEGANRGDVILRT